MSSLASISPAGRIGRSSFAIAIAIVYILSFLSQMLLAAPMMARIGPWPFALAQAVLIWAWYVLHARRLRDAGRGSGTAVGIAIVYGLAIILLLLIVTATAPSPPATTPAAADQEAPTLLSFFLVLYLLALLTADPSLGVFAYLLIAVAILLLTPVAIAFGFTIWAATLSPAPRLP